jgi:signal transduction histidine kinase
MIRPLAVLPASCAISTAFGERAGNHGPTAEYDVTAYSAERWTSLLRATLEGLAEGILVLDREDTVVTYNEQFLELWKIPVDLASRRHNQTMIRYVLDQLCDPDTFIEAARQNRANPEREYFLSLRFKDGRVLERNCRPQRLGNEILGRVVAYRDVTEKIRLLEQAQQAVRLRDDALSIVAHEIRRPLTSMQLAVQTLRHASLPAEAIPRSLDIIDRSQRRVADFVDKLLDLGRIRSGDLKLDLEPTDLVEVVREVVARHEAELQRCGSEVGLRTGSTVVGNWDRLRLDQVVTNLLSNAIKFGSGKPIQVEISAQAGVALLVVRDHGIGIPEQSQQRIFQAFQRDVSLRQVEGLGLGLHIARTIVDALGGKLGVASEPGAGATFRVELPQAL